MSRAVGGAGSDRAPRPRVRQARWREGFPRQSVLGICGDLGLAIQRERGMCLLLPRDGNVARSPDRRGAHGVYFSCTGPQVSRNLGGYPQPCGSGSLLRSDLPLPVSERAGVQPTVFRMASSRRWAGRPFLDRATGSLTTGGTRGDGYVYRFRRWLPYRP